MKAAAEEMEIDVAVTLGAVGVPEPPPLHAAAPTDTRANTNRLRRTISPPMKVRPE
jgi:hypothetical protein